MEQYLAHFRVIRSYMREVSKADAEGHYIVDVAPLPDGQMQFRRGHKGGFRGGGATSVPERDGSSVARDGLAPPDLACAAQRRH